MAWEGDSCNNSKVQTPGMRRTRNRRMKTYGFPFTGNTFLVSEPDAINCSCRTKMNSGLNGLVGHQPLQQKIRRLLRAVICTQAEGGTLTNLPLWSRRPNHRVRCTKMPPSQSFKLEMCGLSGTPLTTKRYGCKQELEKTTSPEQPR